MAALLEFSTLKTIVLNMTNLRLSPKSDALANK